MKLRYCKHCEKELELWISESSWDFKRRNYCDDKCEAEPKEDEDADPMQLFNLRGR